MSQPHGQANNFPEKMKICTLTLVDKLNRPPIYILSDVHCFDGSLIKLVIVIGLLYCEFIILHPDQIAKFLT